MTGQASLPGDLTEPLRPAKPWRGGSKSWEFQTVSIFQRLMSNRRNQTLRPTSTQIQRDVQIRAQRGGPGWLSHTEGRQDSHRVVLMAGVRNSRMSTLAGT